jgi:organic radical activating enzyme
VNTSTFKPDLVIEATSVCDRACPGCYAPNTVSLESGSLLQASRPELFLDPKILDNRLAEISHDHLVKQIAVRGGEPSIHPELRAIIEAIAKYTSGIVLETHGRWALTNDLTRNNLIELFREFKVVVKISFDKMHSLGKRDLFLIWDELNLAGVQTLIAITEPNETEFEKTRKQCSWIPNSQIIFQKQALSAAELMAPVIGVISRTGRLNRTLTTKFATAHHQGGVA